LNISRLTFLYSARQKDYLITPYITCVAAKFFLYFGRVNRVNFIINKSQASMKWRKSGKKNYCSID
jgi:hypothetical protein